MSWSRRSPARDRTAVALVGLICGAGLAAAGIPGGGFVGALAGAAIVGILLRAQIVVRPWVKTIMRAVIGTSLGIALAGIPSSQLARWAVSAAIYVVCVIGLSAGIGVLYARRLGIPVLSGLVATAPGGMSEMALIAEEHGLDVEAVVTLQFVRKMLAILLIVPILTLFPL